MTFFRDLETDHEVRVLQSDMSGQFEVVWLDHVSEDLGRGVHGKLQVGLLSVMTDRPSMRREVKPVPGTPANV
jgi:hypothetical protein